MDQAEELRYLVLAVQREGNRQLTEALSPLDLTPAQAEVLQVLEQYQPLTLLQLGELLVCESGSPSRLVTTMVAKGLVQKVVSAVDRRASQLTLTDQARQLLPRLNEIETQFNQAPYAWLDDATIEQALTLLWRFAANSSGGQALKRRKQPR
ncbi:MAG: winged helix DNA-binding protein [Anaerolineae bacterium]|nr:winged helix DNA-binding protein [Anaerolineae bacterium]